MLRFAPVWISSTDHLDALRKIFERATPAQRAKAGFPVRPDFPHVRPLWGLVGMRVPLVYLAAGELEIDESSLHFRGKRYRVFGSLVRGVDAGLTLRVPFSRIVTAERQRFESPVARAYDLDFIRIRSGESGLAGDFLATFGVTFASVFRPDLVAERRDAFLTRVEAVAAERGWSRGGESRVRPA